ncbi:hypothetical protein HAX54_043288 [Datura stramonium]|uniref:Dof zinc finger protein n=1 Tax=Datura stramonium TaxID=4076 RepID=A0ABS8SNC1_DATST|nr:hypothetical protein [Datura stramonium]
MLPPPAGAARGGGGGPAGSIRSGSMAERARLANITKPETALKCPRCESTNTKFCYFNNYNLSQPRHFCKTCRRYWTRGGALRNIPVGGGCRRNNKRSRSKRSRSSKSPIRSERSRNGPIVTSNSTTTTTTTFPTQSTHLPFLNTPFYNFNDINSTQHDLNFGEIQTHGVEYASNNYNQMINLSTRSSFVDQFRFQQLQQFSFFSPLEIHPSNLYQYESGVTDLGNVKVEDNKSNNLGVTISNQFWTDYHSSTSTSQL